MFQQTEVQHILWLESGLTGCNWTLKSYVLTSYIGANLKIKFKGTSNYGSGDAYIYLDGVVLEEIPVTLPSCGSYYFTS